MLRELALQRLSEAEFGTKVYGIQQGLTSRFEIL